ncbi:MAG: hypothetical protein ACLFQ8_03550 [Candidatus Aenigmatarchaeota archaeon]
MIDTVKSLLDEWRVWVLIVALALSLFSLFSNPFASGAVVTDIGDDSPFEGSVETGDRILSINEVSVNGPRDLMEFENYEGTMNVQTANEGLVVVQSDGTGLGLETEEARLVNLDLGMDLVGGTRVLLEPQFEEGLNQTEKSEILTETITALSTRLNVFGLEEMEFETLGNDYIQIEAAGVGRDVVTGLIERTGNFEAFIPRQVDFDNGTTTDFVVDEETHTLRREDGAVYYQDKLLKENTTFNLTVEEPHADGVGEMNITFETRNITEDSVVIAGKIYDSEDIKHVYRSGRDAYVRQNRESGLYEFSFRILISDSGAERFSVLTQGHEDSMMHLFMDKEPVTELSIQPTLIGDVVNEPVITGSRETKEGALEEMGRLQSVLDSGKLPVELKRVQLDSISPRLGEEMIRSSIIAGFGALLAVTVLVYIIFRRKEIVAPVLLTSFSEVLIILGVASLVNWTIDLPAIAGIIAAIGSSVDDQIVITSETVRQKDEDKSRYSLKRRIKRAFFIVFTAAATTIMAMVVLGFVGTGMMRGFAITTIIGVLAGVLITRPVYGKILEKVL